MTKKWKTVKYIGLLVASAVVVLWGVALVHGFVDGSISGIRAGLKLLLVAGILYWLYERWTLLSDN